MSTTDIATRRRPIAPPVVECSDSRTVDLVDNDLRCAVEALVYQVTVQPYGLLDADKIRRLAHELRTTLSNRPQAEVAECPGHLVVTDETVEQGQYVFVAICDCCGRVAGA